MQTIPMLGGRYRLGPEIGSGGMGAVHRAWDERFQREVAIKVLRAGSDGVERERLRREAQYLAHLNHPNLVAVLDAGTDRIHSGEAIWFAMELVAGPDLRTVLRRDGALGGAAVRRLVGGLLAALEALHEAGVVHRDLKPANVLLTAEPMTGRWDVKLVDLGIAQHVLTEHLTSTGQIVGTAAYLSPEQVTGRRIGPATDVYALGLLAIEALTGRIAFPGGPAESATARLVRAPDLPGGIDPAWRSVLTAMTSLQPEGRPAVGALIELVRRLPDDANSASASADAPTELLPVIAHEPADRPTAVLSAPSAPALARPRPRRHLLAAACLLLAVAGAGGWLATLAGGDQQATAAADAVAPQPQVAASSPAPSTTAAAQPLSPTPTPTTAPPTATPSAAPSEATVPAVEPTTGTSDRSRRMEEKVNRFVERFRERLDAPGFTDGSGPQGLWRTTP